MNSKSFKKVFSILMTLALIFGISASSVWADILTVPDSTKDVSLTVQKYLTPQPSTTPGDGITPPAPSSNLKPAQYVEFELTKLINVDTNTTVTNYTKDTSKVYKGTTNANGEIVWSTAVDGLEQGFYILEETYSPYDGTVSSKNPDGIMAAIAAPSIIALPYANANSYNYDVKVFPKNVGDVNTKTVSNPNNVYKPGDTVEWDIRTVINSEKVLTYSIKDTLDSRLDFSKVAVEMILPGNSTVALIDGTDYTWTNNANVVTVTLTSTGIAKVKTNKAIAISTLIETKINLSAFTGSGNDVILNNADLTFENEGSSETTFSIPESSSITLASLEITKINKEKQPLANAKFKIAATEADALAGVFMKDVSGAELVIETNSSGIATASGIPFTESTSDASGNILSATVYLVETEAPAGYDLLQVEAIGGGMIPVVTKVVMVPGTTQTVTDVHGNTVTYTDFTNAQIIEITNYKAFTLPITGGAGTIIFTVVGLVLILGAAFVLIKTRKKEVAE